MPPRLRLSPRPLRSLVSTPIPSHHNGYHTTPSCPHNPNSSVDLTEISHFTTLASSWWDPHGPSRLLHLMNPLRHAFLARCRQTVPDGQPGSTLNSVPPSYGNLDAAALPSDGSPNTTGLKYLDVGCGGGIFSESVARLQSTSHVTGLDPTPAVLTVARAHARRDPALDGKLSYVQSSIEAFSAGVRTGEGGEVAEEKQFDVISMFEVLEHVSSPSKFLELATPLLKPGGWLVGSTICRTWLSWVTTKLMAEEILKIVPRGTHDWSKYINEDEMRNFFEKQPGWDSVVIKGAMYVPGLGWKKVEGTEKMGNYFFGVRRLLVET